MSPPTAPAIRGADESGAGPDYPQPIGHGSGDHHRVSIPPVPRETVIILVVLNLIGLTVLASMAFGSHSARLLLEAQPVLAVANVLAIMWKRSRLARPFDVKVAPTGRTLSPTPPVVSGAAAPPRPVWTGAGGLPTGLGRLNAGRPFVQLSASHGALSLSVRPRVVALAFGFRPLAYRPDDILAVVPIRGRVATGIAVRPALAPESFFWTKEPEAVLTALGEAGFTVDWREQKIRPFAR